MMGKENRKKVTKKMSDMMVWKDVGMIAKATAGNKLAIMFIR